MKKNDKNFTGRVISVKGQKIVIVSVVHTVRHPIYKKQTRIARTFAVHNELAAPAVGDTVRIRETRPMSKTKHFIILEKLV